jgi:hypothetical protein
MLEPLGNTTILPPKQWHPEPQFRGTFHILSSCLITMSLCIWTLLHLNLPRHKQERLQNFRKLGWMILGLLAPELVVWNAWEQKRTVRQLSMLMQEKGYMPRKPKVRERIRLWWKMCSLALTNIEDRPESALPECSNTGVLILGPTLIVGLLSWVEWFAKIQHLRMNVSCPEADNAYLST